MLGQEKKLPYTNPLKLAEELTIYPVTEGLPVQPPASSVFEQLTSPPCLLAGVRRPGGISVRQPRLCQCGLGQLWLPPLQERVNV